MERTWKMKKFLLAFAVAVSCMSAVAATPAFTKAELDLFKPEVVATNSAMTAEQWLRYQEFVLEGLAMTNQLERYLAPKMNKVVLRRMENALTREQCHAFDEKIFPYLVERPVPVGAEIHMWGFPKCATFSLEAYKDKIDFAGYVDSITRDSPYDSKLGPVTRKERVGRFNSTVIRYSWGSISFMSVIQNVELYLIPEVRRQMKLEGRTSVMRKTGSKNPLESWCVQMAYELDQPKFGNLKGLILSTFPDVTWYDIPEVSDEDMQELRSKVISGELPPNERNLWKLRYWLGLEGYNKFVREYNLGAQ